jgi:hypothetical protein
MSSKVTGMIDPESEGAFALLMRGGLLFFGAKIGLLSIACLMLSVSEVRLSRFEGVSDRD